MSNIELSEIPSELVRSALHETIQSLTNSANDRIEITSISEIVAYNASAIIYRVSFTTKDESSSPTSSLILKVSPQNLTRRALLYSRPCFLRDIFIHDEVCKQIYLCLKIENSKCSIDIDLKLQILPYFRKFEQSKGVSDDEDGFNAYPECYRTVDADQNECILLEDLNSSGFTTLDHHSEETTVDHVRLFLNALAKFHAISFAINDQQPEKFKQLTSSLSDIYMYKGNVVAEAYYAYEAENVLKAVSGADDAHLYAKVKEFFAKGALNVGIESIERELNEMATVISCGDAYLCNTMFKNDSNGNPVEISLIDWQLSRHASPVIDFVYFVFSCTTKEMRDIHYDNLLKTYHDHLSAHIRR